MISSLTKELAYMGIQVNYYHVCKRKLWLFSHNFEMEQTSSLVDLGKLLHETSYLRTAKEIELGPIKIDFLARGPEVHDIKRSRRLERAHIAQMLYYLYYLKRRGIVARGVLNYPLLRKRVKVELTEEKEREVEATLASIAQILSLPKPPPPKRKPYCKRCSYYELCWC
jgi:CRISPR-associated exonuclease Cas4